MPTNSFFRRRRDHLTVVHPKKPTPQELADEASALARRCEAAGFSTAAFLVQTASVSIVASDWPLQDSEL
jgi:hypothetical protein